MWEWLRSLFVPAKKSGHVFRPSKRRIYSYVSGYDDKGEEVITHRDPLELWAKIADNANQLDRDWRVGRVEESKFAQTAQKSFIGKIREIFAVKPVEEGGLADSDVVELFWDFMAFVDSLKKTSPQTTTSATATTPATANSSSEARESTKPTAASTSTDPGPSTETSTPTGSPSGSLPEGSSPVPNTTNPSPTGPAGPPGSS